ncbi:GUN4 domain-containing protein [Nostoc sp.]|uniref:GUN4 domain-containing protein n=1 Tax=Nostoc sp. TaxID=1180 RepID=UPI002FF8D3AE
MSPNLLEQSDIDTLGNLLLRSQQSRARESLCLRIGIDPKRLGFLRHSSDVDFVTQLIYYLNEVGDREVLCKLCCQELFPIFNKSPYRSALEEIGVKLNCNHDFGQNYPKNKTVEQLTSPIHSSVPEFRVNYPNQLDKSKPESWFTKIGNVNKKLLAGGAILLVGLAGFAIHGQISQTVVDSKYSALKEHLETEKWQDADHETASIMRDIIGKNKFNPLYVEDIKKIPCTDLNTIYQLWLKYSNKAYGFTIQKQIWRNLGGIDQGPQIESVSSGDVVFKTFLKQVGWSEGISNQNAPKGYFPVTSHWWNAYQPGWLEAIFLRVDACKADK